MTRATETGATGRRWYHRIGPGLITACVVIGPGSILTSSQVGAKYGYALSWVVVAAVAFMMVFTVLGAKLGVVAQQPAGKLVADRAGRWLAVLIGLGVFFISASFQFGNNLGVHSAFKVYVDFDYTVVVFNALSIGFLFAFKNLYKAVERLMMTFVGLMLVAFAVNLFFAAPDAGEVLAGFIPGRGAEIDLTLLGLVGTTFVITAAYFQSYLVRQKGWDRAEMRDGMRDARVGALIMALITLMIMTTAGAVLSGRRLEDVAHVARQLDPLFGEKGTALFCLGLFSAAYSSFLVNSMIGGFILADGLGLSSKPTDTAPKVLTTLVLLTGMFVALWSIQKGQNPIPLIVAAQAATVLASPLMAGALLWLTNRRDVIGDDRNGVATNLLAGLGFLLLLAMSIYAATGPIPGRIAQWREQSVLPGAWQSDDASYRLVISEDRAVLSEDGSAATYAWDIVPSQTPKLLRLYRVESQGEIRLEPTRTFAYRIDDSTMTLEEIPRGGEPPGELPPPDEPSDRVLRLQRAQAE